MTPPATTALDRALQREKELEQALTDLLAGLRKPGGLAREAAKRAASESLAKVRWERVTSGDEVP